MWDGQSLSVGVEGVDVDFDAGGLGAGGGWPELVSTLHAPRALITVRFQ